MWPSTVVLLKPSIDNDLGLSCSVEPFCVEHFFSQGPVIPFVIYISLRAAWIDLHWFDA